MGTTRRQLRRDILKNLGDLLIVRATADGTDVTLYDTIRLYAELEAFKGREVLFTGGTAANLGQQRFVASSSGQQRSLFFDVPLPAATKVGDECELINTRGVGYRFQDVHDAINEQISIAADRALITAASDLSTFRNGMEIPIPADFRTVERVQFTDPLCTPIQWRTTPKATRPGGNGWWVDRASRALWITGRYGCVVNGQQIKVWGLAEPGPLYDDNDETEIDKEWLTYAALSALMRARAIRMPTPETDRLMFLLSQRADQLRAKLIVRRGPFSTAV